MLVDGYGKTKHCEPKLPPTVITIEMKGTWIKID